MVRKVVRRRRVLRKRRGMKKMRKSVGRSNIKRTSDYAKVCEIVEAPLVATADNAGENVGSLITWCLADYQRPQEVAHAYKYYRLSKVEVSFIPYFNVATTGGGAAARVPQLYMTIDRVSNRFIIPTESELLSRGVSPKMFNRIHKMSFKPNLLQEISLETRQPTDGGGVPLGLDLAGFQNATALFNKWLPTQQSYGYNAQAPGAQINQVLAPNGVNPYALKYHGMAFVASIEGQGADTQITIGDVQYKCTWEFKGPRALKTQAPNPEPNPYVATSSQGNPGAVPNTQPTTYP